MMLKNITDINFIESKQNTSRKDRNRIYSIDENVIKYHISIDKNKRNYNKHIINKYKIMDNMNDDNDMKNLILKDIEYLERKLKEANEKLKQFI
jgi:protein subunit release factor A